MYEYKAMITAVYDGDSVTADIDLGFHTILRRMKLRLNGIDTPEIRGEERPDGLTARQALVDRVFGKEVVIRTFKDRQEKFGRYLADIYLEGESINQWLIEQGHAVSYDGGKRGLMNRPQPVIPETLPPA